MEEYFDRFNFWTNDKNDIKRFTSLCFRSIFEARWNDDSRHFSRRAAALLFSVSLIYGIPKLSNLNSKNLKNSLIFLFVVNKNSNRIIVKGVTQAESL